jgi:hypothetical protein
MEQDKAIQQPDVESSPPEGQKEYEAPEISDFGDLTELTRTNPFAAGADDFSLDFSAV